MQPSRITDAEKASVFAKYGAKTGVTGATCESVVRSASPLLAAVIGPDQIVRYTNVRFTSAGAAMTIQIQTKLGWASPASAKLLPSGSRWLIARNATRT